MSPAVSQPSLATTVVVAVRYGIVLLHRMQENDDMRAVRQSHAAIQMSIICKIDSHLI
jgi:hypothetical protein